MDGLQLWLSGSPGARSLLPGVGLGTTEPLSVVHTRAQIPSSLVSPSFVGSEHDPHQRTLLRW